jgi:hypothetical protein
MVFDVEMNWRTRDYCTPALWPLSRASYCLFINMKYEKTVVARPVINA